MTLFGYFDFAWGWLLCVFGWAVCSRYLVLHALWDYRLGLVMLYERGLLSFYRLVCFGFGV